MLFDALLKAVGAESALWVELPEDMGEACYEADLAKGAGHKYIKRVPTGKERPKWRYYYKVTSWGGVGHEKDFKHEASFKHGEGHYHITAVDGDRLTIKHDETGHERTLTREELSTLLTSHHAAAVKAAKGETKAKRAAAGKRAAGDAAAKAEEYNKKAEEMRKAGYVRLVKNDVNGVPTARWVNPETAAWHDANMTHSWDETPKRPKVADPAEGGGEVPQASDRGTGNGAAEPPPEEEVIPDLDVKIVSMARFKTSENRPPNFLGLKPEAFGLRRDPGSRYEDYVLTDEARQESKYPPDINKPHEALTPLQLAARLGLLGVDSPLNDFQEKFFLSMVGRRVEYSRMSEKMQLIWGSIAKSLNAWWTDLNDEDREAFWGTFVDDARQTPLQRVEPPSHHNGDFEIPAGMEKMKAKGYAFHEYQRKGANFALSRERSILAMEMGLGKTLTALGVFHALKERGEVTQMIVTAPLSAHGSWEEHIRDFSDARVALLTSASPKARKAAYDAFARGEIDILVVSPDSVAKKYTKLPDDWNKRQAMLDKAGEGSQVKVGIGPFDIYFKEGGKWTNSRGELRADTIPSSAQIMDSDSDHTRIKNLVEANAEKILRVADEVHKFKNPRSARTGGFVEAISQHPGRLIGMTGTPKPNGAEDFYHIIDSLAPNALGTLPEFKRRYCYAAQDFNGDSAIVGFRPEALGQLYNDASEVFFARTTADPDVVIHIPERTDLAPRIPMDDFQQKITGRMVHWMNFLHNLRWEEKLERQSDVDSYKAEAMRQQLFEARSMDNADTADRIAARVAHLNPQVALLRWQQCAIDPSLLDAESIAADMPDYVSPKMTNIADATVQHLTQNPDKGAVLFCEYNGAIEAMKRALVARGVAEDKIGIYTGATSAKKRKELQDALNSGTISVLIGNTAALETGANLQKRANFVAHMNTPWAPDRITQSTGRVHRQGQQSKVIVYRPTGSHVEELIERTVSRKLMESSQATGRTMQADDAVARSMRTPGKASLDRASIAAVLGIDPSVFSESKDDILSPEELAKKYSEEA